MKLVKLEKIISRIEAEVGAQKIAVLEDAFYLARGEPVGLHQRLPVPRVVDFSAAAPKIVAIKDGSGSFTILFPLAEYDAMVALGVKKKPYKRKLTALAALVEGAVRDATNEYLAGHCQWTGLQNKATSDAKLFAIARKLIGQKESIASPGPSMRGFVLSLDIDHFKSINDRFGHPYGDLVLKAFAQRIDKCVRDWVAAKAPVAVEACVSRPGGEEFQVAVFGPVLEKEAAELGERIRLAISSSPLPSDDESQELGGDVSVPPLHDRGVSTSVGVATFKLAGADDAKQIVARVQKDSDRALYSAKSGGRNCVRVFEDLIKNHGRVLEHHQSAGLVSIDLGSDVGVTVGQEFLVYPADFFGGTAFYVGEGRSRKRVGEFPRHATSRISALYVQPEVSFCVQGVFASGLTGRLEEGSRLEAIPLGSISHLISKGGFMGQRQLATIEEVREGLISSVAAKVPVLVWAVRLSGFDKFCSARGVADANSLLAETFGVIADYLGPAGKVALVSEDCFVFFSGQKDPMLDHLPGSLRAKLEKLASSGVQFTAGVFDGSDFPAVRPEYGVELAAMASASIEDWSPGSVVTVTFSDEAASNAIYRSRNVGDFAAARADFDKLKSIGLELPWVLNQIGLVEFADQNYPEALKAFESAIQASPGEGVLWANKGISLFFSKEYAGAYGAFVKANELIGADRGSLTIYKGAFAVAAYQLRKQGVPVDNELVCEIAKEALAEDLDSFLGIRRSTVERVLGEFLDVALTG
jgi:diguanylate cyclase (GGDEF)-like protein